MATLALALGLAATPPGHAAPAGRRPAAAAARAAEREAARPLATGRARLAIQRAAKRARVPRPLTAVEAAALIAPGDTVYLPIGHSVSKTILKALGVRAAAGGDLSAARPVHIFGLTNVASRRLYDDSGAIQARSVFIGANNRDAIAAGRGAFVPTHLSRVPGLMRSGQQRIDVAVIQVSPPDKNGYVSLGPSTATTLAAIEVARTVIAEVNPNVPKTHGAARIHRSRIDYVVPSSEKLVTIEPTPPSEIDRQIARHVLGLIPERPTLQFGIGAIPDAIAGLLADSGRTDLRVHSEMISDGVMRLVRAGAVKEPITYSFALGSQALLDWMHDNKQLRSQPSDVSNDPRRLAKLERLVSINTALKIDLNGQANAQYVGDRHYSGVGGQQDFFRGAMMARDGKAILVLPSTSTVKDRAGGDELVSRIVFALGKGDVVTTGMHDVQYVVTEYGVAHLEGRTTEARAEALIEIAHPRFRDELRRQVTAAAERRRADVEARGR